MDTDIIQMWDALEMLESGKPIMTKNTKPQGFQKTLILRTKSETNTWAK